MAHIHAGVDFCVNAFIVHDNRLLMIHHRKLDTWLTPGGHIELDELPDEALAREVEEEVGLDLTDPNFNIVQSPHTMDRVRACESLDAGENNNTRILLTPWAVDVHDFPPVKGHRHVVLVYLIRADKKPEVHLHRGEAWGYHWFALDELDHPMYKVMEVIKIYARQAIALVAASSPGAQYVQPSRRPR